MDTAYRYKIIYRVDGEEIEAGCDLYAGIDWILKYLEIGTAYEIYKKYPDGYHLLEKSTVKRN